MTYEQILKQRQALVNELWQVVEKHRAHLTPMMQSDVIGAIEIVKLEFFLSTQEEHNI